MTCSRMQAGEYLRSHSSALSGLRVHNGCLVLLGQLDDQNLQAVTMRKDLARLGKLLLGGSWVVISGVRSPLIMGRMYSYPTYSPTRNYP